MLYQLKKKCFLAFTWTVLFIYDYQYNIYILFLFCFVRVFFHVYVGKTKKEICCKMTNTHTHIHTHEEKCSTRVKAYTYFLIFNHQSGGREIIICDIIVCISVRVVCSREFVLFFKV